MKNMLCSYLLIHLSDLATSLISTNGGISVSSFGSTVRLPSTLTIVFDRTISSKGIVPLLKARVIFGLQ